MSNILPTDPFDPRPQSIRGFQASRSVRKAVVQLFNYGLGTGLKEAKDAQDSGALARACGTALDAEIDLLEWGVHRAGNSSAKLELVARRVQLLATLNDRRISGRFGGW